jgi:hypothetical protein
MDGTTRRDGQFLIGMLVLLVAFAVVLGYGM